MAKTSEVNTNPGHDRLLVARRSFTFMHRLTSALGTAYSFGGRPPEKTRFKYGGQR